MFTMITPSQGDLILQTLIGDSNSSLWFGVYLPQQGSKRKSGLKPYTWGSDRFNNKNCVHLNMQGTLMYKSAVSNVTESNGPLGYTRPDFTSREPLTRILNAGTFKFTQYCTLRSTAHQSIVYYQYYTPGGWQKVEVSLEFDSKSDSHFRIIRRYKLSWVKTGIVVDSHSLCEYTQIFYGSQIRYKRNTVNGTLKQSYPMYPIGPWGSLFQPFVFVMNVGAYNFSAPSARDIYHRLVKWRMEVQQDDLSSFGSLSIDAVQALKVFDGQLSLLLRDLVSFNGTVKSFFKGITSLSSKGLSTAYLSYHYGLRLTYRDMSDLLGSFRSVGDGIKGYNTSRSRLRRAVVCKSFPKLAVDYEYNMKLYVRDYPDWIVKALNTLMVADFFPTLELVWDIIPFSFVVDWFGRVGDYLEMLDSSTLLSTYHVLSCVYSRKATMKCKFGDIFPEFAGLVYGELTISYYTRHVSLSPPPFSLDYSTPHSFNNWLEGAALIVQRVSRV